MLFPQEAQNSHVYWVSVSLRGSSGTVPAGTGWVGGGCSSGVGGGACAMPVSAFVTLCSPRIPRRLAPGLLLLRCELSLPPQWRYCIRLENLDSDVVQLRERHWRIFSLSGTLETVRGRGVVGRVSILGPIMPSFWSCPAGPEAWCMGSSSSGVRDRGSVYESIELLKVKPHNYPVREVSYNPFHR